MARSMLLVSRLSIKAHFSHSPTASRESLAVLLVAPAVLPPVALHSERAKRTRRVISRRAKKCVRNAG